MQELDDKFSDLYKKIYLVRFKGARNTDIIPESEEFFVICDEATGLAEKYSQKKATSLSLLEKYITADIVVLMLLIGYEFIKAIQYAAMNRLLQRKVYLDDATGLPNKNKCEELLSEENRMQIPVSAVLILIISGVLMTAEVMKLVMPISVDLPSACGLPCRQSSLWGEQVEMSFLQLPMDWTGNR